MAIYTYLEDVIAHYKKGDDEKRLLRMINSALKYEHINKEQYRSLRNYLWDKKNNPDK